MHNFRTLYETKAAELAIARAKKDCNTEALETAGAVSTTSQTYRPGFNVDYDPALTASDSVAAGLAAGLLVVAGMLGMALLQNHANGFTPDRLYLTILCSNFILFMLLFAALLLYSIPGWVRKHSRHHRLYRQQLEAVWTTVRTCLDENNYNGNRWTINELPAHRLEATLNYLPSSPGSAWLSPANLSNWSSANTGNTNTIFVDARDKWMVYLRIRLEEEPLGTRVTAMWICSWDRNYSADSSLYLDSQERQKALADLDSLMDKAYGQWDKKLGPAMIGGNFRQSKFFWWFDPNPLG